MLLCPEFLLSVAFEDSDDDEAVAFEDSEELEEAFDSLEDDEDFDSDDLEDDAFVTVAAAADDDREDEASALDEDVFMTTEDETVDEELSDTAAIMPTGWGALSCIIERPWRSGAAATVVASKMRATGKCIVIQDARSRRASKKKAIRR